MQHQLIAIIFALAATMSSAQHAQAQAQSQGQGGASDAKPRAIATKASAPSIGPSVPANQLRPMAVGASQPSSTTASAALPAQSDRAALSQTLAGLEGALSRIEDKQSKVWWATLFSAAIGALASGLFGLWLQGRLLNHQTNQAVAQAEHDEDLTDRKAEHEANQALFNLRVRQFMELYGPLRMKFDGSNKVYRLMNDELIAMNPERFRDASAIPDHKDDVDPDGRLFQIYDEAEARWRKFRTVTDLDIVYGQGFGVDAYFDRIIQFGDGISKLMLEKAGLVMPQDGKLLDAFGKYLAHFELLKELHALSQPSQGDSNAAVKRPLKVRDTAAFPTEIQQLVKDGAEKLLLELAKGPVSPVQRS